MVPTCYLVSYNGPDDRWITSGVYASIQAARNEYPEIPQDYQSGESIFEDGSEVRKIEALPYRQ